MIILFPFLLTRNIHRFLLLARTRSFKTLLYVGGTYARLVYTWCQNISYNDIPHCSGATGIGPLYRESFVRGVIRTRRQSYGESFVRGIDNQFRCKDSVQSM